MNNLEHKEIVEKVVTKITSESVLSTERMAYGICNEVYCVTLPYRKLIVRLNQYPSQMEGSEKYIPLFKSRGIKVPDILTSDYSKSELPFAYQVFTWIEGDDLGKVIKNLGDEEIKNIAKDIADIINKLSTIPTNGQFGSVGKEEKDLDNSWLRILEKLLNDVKRKNEKTGVVGARYIEIFGRVLQKYKNYFENVPSTFYYKDMNSKNVIISNGKFSGLIDLDNVAYGDPLDAIGTIQTSWYGTHYGELYAKTIMDVLGLDKKQREMVDVYALINKIRWLSEKGIQYNKNTSTEINLEAVQKDKEIIEKLIVVLKI